MTPRRVRVLTIALAGTTGLAAVISGSLTTALVFAACVVPVAFLTIGAMRQIDLDEMYERRAGRDLGEDVP